MIYLSDILLRFLENAYKFGGSERPIDVKVVLAEPYAEIIVRDYGPGFLEELDANRVFEPFMQIKRDVYEQQGCGVGPKQCVQLLPPWPLTVSPEELPRGSYRFQQGRGTEA